MQQALNMRHPRLVLVDNQMSGESFVSIGPLVLAAICADQGVPPEFVRFPRRMESSAFVEYASGADVVAFSTVCANYPRVLLLAERLKAISPKTLVVLGGAQASVTATPTLRAFPAVDLIIRGEAETGWALFVDQAKTGQWYFSKIPGAVWRTSTGIEESAPAPLLDDLDLTPVPRFEAIRELPSHGTARIEVGRGCPYNCSYCSTSAFFSRKYRLKSPSRIVAEMDRIHTMFGIRSFDFVHDMFTAKQSHIRAICRELKARPYKWGCWSRADVLNQELLSLLRESGCIGFFIGLETGSSRLQKVMRKNLDLHQAVSNIRLAKEMGFGITTSIMLGYPGETRADLKDSLILALELMGGLADQINFLPFVPLAGTDAAKEASRYEFDGKVSNMVETEKGVSAAEAGLIYDHFNIFSAFYHPAGSEYSRVDYLALVALLENLKEYPSVKRFVLERDRAGFIDFLTVGNFGVDVYQLSDREIAESMLACYASRSQHQLPLISLLRREAMAFTSTFRRALY